MFALLMMANYLFERARFRARAVLDGDPESGALSLEWIVIAVLVAAAAAGVGIAITTAINNQESKLP
jgi:Flp pilus assembly pilin Flp